MGRTFSLIKRRTLIKTALGASAFAALGAPAIAQNLTPRKMILAHVSAPPERPAIVFEWLCRELTARSNGAWDVEFAGRTIFTKEIEIVNGVKTGTIAMGTPVGAAATLFPEMGVFLVPYLIENYAKAYAALNFEVGDELDKTFQEKYGIKVVYFFDFGFRHFYNNARPIHTPKDLVGLKMRVQPSKVFADTINGLGGVAVSIPGPEIYTASQQGVVDGGDMPVANMVANKLQEVSKFYSLTRHNYGASLLAINLDVWKSMSSDEQQLLMAVGKEAQAKHRETTESFDSLEGAHKELDPYGLAINEADVQAFREVAMAKVWPAYREQYPALWEKLASAN